MKSAESPSVIYRYTVPWIEIYTWEFIVIKACYCLTLLCYILNQDGADHLSLLSHNTGNFFPSLWMDSRRVFSVARDTDVVPWWNNVAIKLISSFTSQVRINLMS